MPHEWSPRRHQLPALAALDRGVKRALLLWHRRAGKDAATINWCAKEMARQATSVLYLLPEFKQAKRVMWREIDPITGKTHIDQALPEQLRVNSNQTEGFVKLWNGSVLQLGGFDTIDSYVGIGPRIVVLSEYAVSQHAPRAWNLLVPMLLMNGGTAIFPYTPRGKNHGKELFDNAKGSGDWFVSRQTIDDTGLVSREVIQAEIDSGSFTEDYAKQEFWLSFEAPNSGSYYGRLIEALEANGQILDIEHDPSLPVVTWWDIGVDDATAIWFTQPERGGRIRVIDYYEAEGEGTGHYLDQLDRRRAMGWSFDPGGQMVPHDFASRGFATGESPLGVARKRGWPMRVVDQHEVQHGIDAVRRALPRMYFDRRRTAKGLTHLREYRKKWSDQLQTFLGPLHDQHSHAADAVRTGVWGMKGSGFALSANPSRAAAAERPAWAQPQQHQGGATAYDELRYR